MLVLGTTHGCHRPVTTGLLPHLLGEDFGGDPIALRSQMHVRRHQVAPRIDSTDHVDHRHRIIQPLRQQPLQSSSCGRRTTAPTFCSRRDRPTYLTGALPRRVGDSVYQPWKISNALLESRRCVWHPMQKPGGGVRSNSQRTPRLCI